MFLKRLFKPVLALTLAAVVFTGAGFGQTRQHDVSVSCGFLSIDQMADLLGNALTIVLTLGTYKKDNLEYSAVPFLTYHYSANGKFGFGAAIGGYASSGELQILDSLVGEFKEQNYVVAAELDYHWVMQPGFQLYSGAGFGVRYRHGTYRDAEVTDTDNKVLPTFHLNALGVRFGNKIGFFGEIGAGYKGLISVGLNAQF
ncbi:MAG: hypothetical protein H6P96_705 [Candidatus Aminicenantes bacterium]|nr:hypothetical protein [Candidatus Aminicenantes bacterium]